MRDAVVKLPKVDFVLCTSLRLYKNFAATKDVQDSPKQKEFALHMAQLSSVNFAVLTGVITKRREEESVRSTELMMIHFLLVERLTTAHR